MIEIKELHNRLVQYGVDNVLNILGLSCTVQGKYYCAGDIHGGAGKSFMVNRAGQYAGMWRDWSDDSNGDLVDLWMQNRGVSMREAIEQICALLGIDPSASGEMAVSLPRIAPVKKGEERTDDGEFEECYDDANPNALDAAMKQLRANSKAMAWLAGRRLKPSTANYFRMGLTREFKNKDGTVSENCLRVPLINSHGHRVQRSVFYNIPGVTKNPRSSNGWCSGAPGLFFNAGKEPCHKEIFICEGPKDLWIVHQELTKIGLHNRLLFATSTHGSGVPAGMSHFLSGFDKVYLGHDNDAPGRKTAMKWASTRPKAQMFRVFVPEGMGKDWTDFFKNGGTGKQFQDLIESARPISEFGDDGYLEAGQILTDGDELERHDEGLACGPPPVPTELPGLPTGPEENQGDEDMTEEALEEDETDEAELEGVDEGAGEPEPAASDEGEAPVRLDAPGKNQHQALPRPDKPPGGGRREQQQAPAKPLAESLAFLEFGFDNRNLYHPIVVLTQEAAQTGIRTWMPPTLIRDNMRTIRLEPCDGGTGDHVLPNGVRIPGEVLARKRGSSWTPESIAAWMAGRPARPQTELARDLRTILESYGLGDQASELANEIMHAHVQYILDDSPVTVLVCPDARDQARLALVLESLLPNPLVLGPIPPFQTAKAVHERKGSVVFLGYSQGHGPNAQGAYLHECLIRAGQRTRTSAWADPETGVIWNFNLFGAKYFLVAEPAGIEAKTIRIDRPIAPVSDGQPAVLARLRDDLHTWFFSSAQALHRVYKGQQVKEERDKMMLETGQ